MFVADTYNNRIQVFAKPSLLQTTIITSATDGNGNPVQNDSSTSSNQITFQFNATGGTPPITFQCSLDNSAFSSCSSSQTYTNSAVGQHTALSRATDNSGNQGSAVAFIWQVTTPLPYSPAQTTITSATDGNGNRVQDGGSTVSTYITFKVTATRGTNPIAGFECSLDGKAFSTCATANSGTVSYHNLAAGQKYTFEVRAVDTTGNKDSTPANSKIIFIL